MLITWLTPIFATGLRLGKDLAKKNIQNSRRRILFDVQSWKFHFLSEINSTSVLPSAVDLVGVNSASHGHEHKESCAVKMVEQERVEMMSMSPVVDGYVEKLAQVSSTWLVGQPQPLVCAVRIFWPAG